MDTNSKIQVQVKSEYKEEQSEPENDKFVFVYHITITNNDSVDINLLNRYWLITNGDGTTSEVSGSGVVGEQPNIAPTQSYSYSSGCVLPTPVGTMEGYYEIQLPDKRMVKAAIPVFSLSDPSVLH